MNLVCAFLIITQSPYETNPVKIVISSGFTLYQKIVSPAQGDVCNFEPSCSHFAKKSIEKYGLWGVLMGADRLMRCNPWAHKHVHTYYSGIKNYKIYDPIENNFIFGKIEKTDDTTESE